MRKIITILISLVVFLIGAALVVPFLIPLDTYKSELVAQLSERTGREISIKGDIKFKLLPDIAISMKDVSVGNPEGFSDKNFIAIDTLDAEVALKPLFSKQFVIQKLVLKKPDIHLEVNKSGQPNWNVSFNTPALTLHVPDIAFMAAAYAAEPDQGSYSLQMFSLSGLSVEKGALSYNNAATGAAYAASEVNITADAVAFDKPLAIKGDLNWNGEKVTITAGASSLETIQSNNRSTLKAKVDAKHMKLSFQGNVSGTTADGNLEFGSESLVGLMKWLGTPTAYNKTKLLFAYRGKLSCNFTEAQCDLSEGDYALDKLLFKGNLGVNWSGQVPSVKGNLSTNTLDINPYMSEAAADSSALMPSAYAANPRWSTETIDLSGLKAINADLNLRIAELLFKQMQLTNNILFMNLNGGQLKLDIQKTELHGGSLSGNLGASSGGSISANLQASGIDIQKVLMSMMDDSRISGTARMQLNVTAKGNSQAQWISSLAGSGNAIIQNGSIKGVNLAQMARNLKSAFQAESATQQTDFSELSGTYRFQNGVLHNQDLAMKSPYIRLSGQGEINLPAYTIAYRLVPEFVNTSKGQGVVVSEEDRTGITVPIIVSGALDNPQFAPDLQNIVQDVLQNPDKYKDVVKGVRDNVKGEIKGTKEDIRNIKEEVKSLKDLFGGKKKTVPDNAPAAPAPAPVAPVTSEPVAPISQPETSPQPSAPATETATPQASSSVPEPAPDISPPPPAP